MTPPSKQRQRRDRGGMSLELVLMTPIFVAFLMLLAGVGRMVDAQSQIDGAARDAVRAASIARSAGDAGRLADIAGTASLREHNWCQGGPQVVTDVGEWGAGGRVSVAVRCTVDLGDLSFIGLPGTKSFTGTAVAPIDTYTYRGPQGVDDPPQDSG